VIAYTERYLHFIRATASPDAQQTLLMPLVSISPGERHGGGGHVSRRETMFMSDHGNFYLHRAWADGADEGDIQYAESMTVVSDEFAEAWLLDQDQEDLVRAIFLGERIAEKE